MIVKIGFTGTRKGTTYPQLQRLIIYFGEAYKPGAELHQGCCIGADEEAARAAKALGFRIIGHPPIDQSKMSIIAYEICDELRQPKKFTDRNHDICDETYELTACPLTEEEVLRSGTWATIRYNRKVHPSKPITIFKP